MFGSYNTKSVVVTYDYDPAADDVLPVFTAPKACEITGARAIAANAVNAATDNYFSVSLINAGAAGAGTTVVAAAVGGTAGWAALTPKTFTISDGTLAAGEVVAASYDETGTGTFGVMTIQVDYVLGEVD